MQTDTLKDLLASATPGPWKWDKELDRISGVFRASCEQNMEFLSWSEWIDVAPAGSCFEERKPVSKEANARLIALAPQLAAEVIRLREALAPFAKAGELFPEEIGTLGFVEGIYQPEAGREYSICGDDLRRARIARDSKAEAV